jgi:hypothetical protein
MLKPQAGRGVDSLIQSAYFVALPLFGSLSLLAPGRAAECRL